MKECVYKGCNFPEGNCKGDCQKALREIREQALPDGSAFAVVSLPLPTDHWIYKATGEPPAQLIGFEALKPALLHALEYAVRGATMSGSAMDFDPDALVQNFMVGAFGYHPHRRAHTPACRYEHFLSYTGLEHNDSLRLAFFHGADEVRENAVCPACASPAAESDTQTGLFISGDTQADPVSHPAHYTAHPSGVECIQITEHMGFCLGNAVKYIWRADLKADAIEDLKKARWYIDRELQKRGAA